MLKFARFLKQFKKEVLIGPVFKLTEAVFELIVPLVMAQAQIIDVGIANGDRGYVLRMGGVMVLLGLVGLGCALICQYCAARASQGFGCALICQYCAARASQGFGTVLRSEMFRHINTLSHGEIDQIGTPSLITRITNDVNQLQLAVAMLIRLVVRAPFLVIGATVMALLLDWKLACIFFVAAPLMALVLYLVMSRSIPFYRIIQKKGPHLADYPGKPLGRAGHPGLFQTGEGEGTLCTGQRRPDEHLHRGGTHLGALKPPDQRHHQPGHRRGYLVRRLPG